MSRLHTGKILYETHKSHRSRGNDIEHNSCAYKCENLKCRKQIAFESKKITCNRE